MLAMIFEDEPELCNEKAYELGFGENVFWKNKNMFFDIDSIENRRSHTYKWEKQVRQRAGKSGGTLQ